MAQTRNGATSAESAASAEPRDTGIADELLALEKRYWQAMKDQDVQTALDLTDDPCIVTGAQGVARIDRDRFGDVMQATNARIEDVYINPDVQVVPLGPDAAVLAYTVHERLTVDGKSVTIDAADASTWVRRGGRWRCAVHTESIQGDPFGRDRTTA
jgi:ketosteroid isomerase-like protein